MFKFCIFVVLLVHLVVAEQGELYIKVQKPSGSAATTISGLFYYMFGTSEKYKSLQVPEFEFPTRIDIRDVELKSETHFIEFLLRNEWIQRKLGIRMRYSNGLFPDVTGDVFDGTGLPIKVEVEYWAENYKIHGHPFGGCHLIISLFRKPKTRVIKGVPVWSFYVWDKVSRNMRFCLYEDVSYNFIAHKTSKSEEDDMSVSAQKIKDRLPNLSQKEPAPKNKSFMGEKTWIYSIPKKCQPDIQKVIKEPRRCIVCGTVVKRSKSKFCSLKCINASYLDYTYFRDLDD